MLNVKAASLVLIKDSLPWLWSSAGESWFNHTSILLLPYFPFTYFAHPALPPGSQNSCLMATGWMCQKSGTPPIKWLLCIYSFFALRCYCLGIKTGFLLPNKILLSWSTLFLITFLDKNNFPFPGVRIEVASVINWRGRWQLVYESNLPSRHWYSSYWNGCTNRAESDHLLTSCLFKIILLPFFEKIRIGLDFCFLQFLWVSLSQLFLSARQIVRLTPK